MTSIIGPIGDGPILLPTGGGGGTLNGDGSGDGGATEEPQVDGPGDSPGETTADGEPIGEFPCGPNERLTLMGQCEPADATPVGPGDGGFEPPPEADFELDTPSESEIAGLAAIAALVGLLLWWARRS